MAEERRRHYRVTPEALRDIQAHFFLDRLPTPVSVTLVDIAAGGAAIDLPDLKRGDLFMGEHPHLELTSPELREPVRIESEIVNLRNGVDRPLRAGLAFRNWMDNRSTLDPQLWRLFNQRRTVRVEPES
jgi:c-di-GMP-binding flagellar brake protein YcgR